ncbi:hypothetical protein SM68_04710, partial [Klebsiella pneumoniae]
MLCLQTMRLHLDGLFGEGGLNHQLNLEKA